MFQFDIPANVYFALDKHRQIKIRLILLELRRSSVVKNKDLYMEHSFATSQILLTTAFHWRPCVDKISLSPTHGCKISLSLTCGRKISSLPWPTSCQGPACRAQMIFTGQPTCLNTATSRLILISCPRFLSWLI